MDHPHASRFGVRVCGVRDDAPYGPDADEQPGRRGRHVPRMDELVGGFLPIGGGAPEDEPPPDLDSLDDEQLQASLDEAIAAFNELRGRDSVDEQDLAEMRRLADHADTLRAEQAARVERAAEAQREIEALSQRVQPTVEGEPEPEPEAESEPEGDGEGEPEVVDGEATDEAEPTEVVQPEEIAASGRRRMNLAAIRARQRQVQAPAAARPGPIITASSDVPGIATGQQIDVEQLAEAVTRRAGSLKTKSGHALVASYALPFDEALIVDHDDVMSGTRAVVAAADQSRLPGGDVVASGGWCAPSETVYDVADIACPDMLWGPPEIQVRRGGLRFFRTPTLSTGDLTFEWTEAQDEAAAEPEGGTKECFSVACPDPIDVRCVAVGACIEAGLLTERAFPELVSWYTRNAMVAHEIVISRRIFQDAIDADITQNITVGETFAGFSAVYAAVALQIADLVEKHSLCEATGVEVVFPWWARNLFLADIARQQGLTLADVDTAVIRRVFSQIGAMVSFARSLPPNVPTSIGGADVPLGWPDSVPFLLFPAGGFQIGRGPSVDLGVVQDSAKFATNDHTALFTEECVVLVTRGPEARFVTVPVCPDGSVGARASGIECPIDGGEVSS